MYVASRDLKVRPTAAHGRRARRAADEEGSAYVADGEELAQQVHRDAGAVARGGADVVDRRDLGGERLRGGVDRGGVEGTVAQDGFGAGRADHRRGDAAERDAHVRDGRAMR